MKFRMKMQKKGRLKKISLLVLSILFFSLIFIAAQNTNENFSEQEQSESANPCSNIECDSSIITCPDGSAVSCQNTCLETGECTNCIPDCTGHEANETTPLEINQTFPLPNETLPKQPEQPEQPGKPELNIEIFYPKKITRGEIIEIKASITNSDRGNAKNVLLNWQLPAGFNIISGNKEENCGNLKSNDTCTSVITIQTLISTLLGKNEIKIFVSYENE